MKAARSQATYADLLQVREPLVAELIEGDLYTSPRPAIAHARVASAIGQDLRSFDQPPGAPDAPGGWWIFDEPELHVGADVLVPDLAGWRRQRLPVLPDDAAFTLIPDWVCEVLSPTSAALDRTRKMPIYAREQVPHLWLVDPQTRTLEVYRLDHELVRWIVTGSFAGDEQVCAPPFETLALDMRRWWGEI